MVIKLSSAIWSEIIRDLRKQVLFQTKIAPLKFNYHLITAILKNGSNSARANIWSSSWVVKKCKQKGFYISFCTRNRNNAIS